MERGVRMDQHSKLEIFLSIILCLISIGIFLMSANFPDASGNLKPNTFPRIMSSLLFILSLFLIYKNIFKKKDKNKVIFDINKKEYKYILFLIILILIYIYLIKILGFILTSIIFMSILIYLFGEKRKTIIFIFPTIFILALYLVFSKLAMVPLPQGLIENLF